MAAAPRFGSSFGVMQGRLSKQTEHGYQAFPWDDWKLEFARAADRGLQHIEWVLESRKWESNPIVSRVHEVADITQRTGVAVRSVCADYLMDTPLEAANGDSWGRLGLLLNSMRVIGASYLVIPFVDQSSFYGSPAGASFLGCVDVLHGQALDAGVTVALETDLGPNEFAEVLTDLDPCVFGVNYDIGNSSSLGYNASEELDAYGARVAVLHIKDRVRGGGSVPLGTGDADIPFVLRNMAARAFRGVTTMQAFRDHEGLAVLDGQLAGIGALINGIGDATR